MYKYSMYIYCMCFPAVFVIYLIAAGDCRWQVIIVCSKLVSFDSYSVALFIINLDYFSTRFSQEFIFRMVKNKQRVKNCFTGLFRLWIHIHLSSNYYSSNCVQYIQYVALFQLLQCIFVYNFSEILWILLVLCEIIYQT